MTAPRSWPLLERRELRDAVAARLRAADTVGVVVAGEAGTGKTTLAQHVRAELGTTVLTVRGSALVAEVPFGALHPHLTALPDDAVADPLAVTRALGLALRESGGARPVVVVDNSALVDELSAHVLAGLAESGAAALLVTAVDVVDMPQAFVELWRDDLLPVVPVPPLTDDEVTALATDYLGAPVAASSLRYLAEVSEGNPLLLRYLVDDHLESGLLTANDGVWALTAGQRPTGARPASLVATRLGRWSPAEREALEVVALTEHLPVALLLELVEPTALERLERSRVVVVDGEPAPAVRIASRLVADVVRRGVPFTRRRVLRDRVVAAGADLTAGPPRQLLSFAVWTLESGAPLDPGVAVRAARAANTLFDPELALRLVGTVSDPAHRAEAAVVRARALRRMGLAAHAAQVAQALLDDPATPPPDRVALVRELAAALVWVDGGPARGEAALAAVRAAVDDPALARSLDLPGFELRLAGGAGAELVEPLTRLHAEGPDGDRRRWLIGSALLAAVLAGVGRQHDAQALLAEVGAAVDAADDADLKVHASLGLFLATVRCGLWARALEVLGSGPVGAGQRALHAGAAVETAQGVLHAWAGRAAAGRTALLSALSQARRRDPFLSTGQVLAGLALCAALDGDAAAARAALAEHGVQRYAPYDLAVAARYCLLTARALLGDDVLDEMVARAERHLAAGQAMDGVLLLAAAARRGSAEAVRRLRAAPLPQPGPLAAAIAAFADGLAEEDAAALVHAGQALLEVGDPGFAADAAAAALALPSAGREAVRAAQRLQQTARRRIGTAAAPGGAPAVPDGLTPREHEVASRAAARLTNQEIARELHLSVRTVESYLQSAFGKLGINSRTELRDVLPVAS
ncbi:LuxR C-terminal-related transcriptional regulator [Blastococcus sp. SYSU D00669]